MSCPMRCFWRAIWLFSLGLFLHCGEARVLTVSPVGPLYRVVGSRLSIPCNVSGFSDDSMRKEFEFRFTVPEKPTLNVISSKDRSFSYNIYSERIDAKDITLRHLSPNSALLEIQSLRKGDEGDFECAVINAESTYDGDYKATTSVKVINNSLSVSTPVSTALSYTEGDALTLTCQASSNTAQHTHLSVAWYLHKMGEDVPRPIISLDRDFTLNPGQGFERRHKAGLIRLDKVGEATYKLKMAQLELSDQGRIYCQAQEWIQDPDRSWYSITHKDSEKSTLNVKAKEVPTSFLVVKILVQPTALLEGQELSLSCNINAQDLSGKFFSVAWLRGHSELARMGPTGILSVGSEYSVQEKKGELRAARIDERLYRLVLHPVRTEDQGQYSCRAWPLERDQDGGFTEGEAKDSSPVQVSISSTEISVYMQNSVSIEEGEKLNLTCKAYGIQGQLSVTWQHRAATAPTETFTDVASLNREGVMEIAAEFLSKVTATRPAIDTFTLELDEVTSSDSGVYQCAVSEWKINSKTISQSQRANVTVASTESLVKLKLVTRKKSNVTVGENVEMMCLVRGLNVPATLTWSRQHNASTTETILTQYSNGSINWSGEQHHYQLKVQKTNEKEVINYLIINRATHREAGLYQCHVSVFLENVHKKLPPSNQLGVTVMNPVSTLTLTSSPTLRRNIRTDIDMNCSVKSKSSKTSRFAVTWLLQQEAENKIILKSDQDALMAFGSQLDHSYRQRISMKRAEGPTFELSIRQTQISDNGSYICEVMEWLQNPNGTWYQLQSVSKTVKLILTESGDAKAVSTCQSGILTGILAFLLFCALLVILALVLKMCWRMGKEKPSKKSLWTEEISLNAKLSAEH